MSDFVYMIKFDAKARATIYMCKRGGCVIRLIIFYLNLAFFASIWIYLCVNTSLLVWAHGEIRNISIFKHDTHRLISR